VVRVGISPTSPSYANDRLFDLSPPLNRDNLLQIWYDLRQSCLDCGWEVKTWDNLADEFDVYLILDPYPQKLKIIGPERLRRSIVQFGEPPDVVPLQYEENNLKYIAENCPFVLCYNRSLCEKYGFIYRRWQIHPYLQKEPHVVAASDRAGVGMVATNKYKRSFLSKLKFRLEFVKTISKNPELANNFVLYGSNWLKAIGVMRTLIPNVIAGNCRIIDKALLKIENKIPWNMNLKKFYKGFVDSKAEVLTKCKFNVIIESMYWQGYVSEKIFDAIQYGCVPIYFGSDDVGDSVPSSIFINGRSFSDPMDAIRFALSLLDSDVDDMIQKGQTWLGSEEFEANFGRQAYIESIKESISKLIF
jgi:hypothetical protein